MSTDKIPPRKIVHPKPKPKGKHKTPKFKKPQKTASIDVFRTVFSADAGAESSGQSNKTFKLRLKSKLARIDKRVQRIQRHILDGKKRSKSPKKINGIADRIDASVRAEADFYLKIRNNLKGLAITEIDRGISGEIKGVRLAGEYLTIPRLVQLHFSKSCTQAAELLKQGMLIRFSREQGTEFIVERAIIRYLEKDQISQ